MDKYQTMLALILYYLAVMFTSAFFQPGTQNIITKEAVNGWDILNLFLGGLYLNVPGVPLLLAVIISLPFWCLLAYFIWLNLPTITVLGNSFQTKEP